jgi:hypothetical protein
MGAKKDTFMADDPNSRKDVHGMRKVDGKGGGRASQGHGLQERCFARGGRHDDDVIE